MVKLNKNRSKNVLAFVTTRARSGSRPIQVVQNDMLPSLESVRLCRLHFKMAAIFADFSHTMAGWYMYV